MHIPVIANDVPIRTKILNNLLEPSERLPSTRALAEDLSVSRNVVLEAYEQLISKGYIITKEGSGTFVSNGAYLENYKIERIPNRESIIGLRHELDNNIIDFRTGVPDLSLFPIKKWGHIYKKHAKI